VRGGGGGGGLEGVQEGTIGGRRWSGRLLRGNRSCYNSVLRDGASTKLECYIISFCSWGSVCQLQVAEV
jgi:hypothetical protein